ncbi:low choriolytic enzyme-like [Chironomus tepperi]|uniref:low choriolytic enzyme-like n=1 Tax=Chironomus tepperi TaxID=113505 RepID=UPI00391FA0AF
MNCCLLLIIVYKIAAFPVDDDFRIIFPDELPNLRNTAEVYSNEPENRLNVADNQTHEYEAQLIDPQIHELDPQMHELDTETPELETELNDDANDIKPDISSLLNDTNILKSDNDTEEFLYEEQPADKPQYGDLFQGDIELLPEQIQILNSTGEEGELADRTGLISAVYRWPKNRDGKVIVPYVISSSDYNSYERKLIKFAMEYIQKYTCIRFIPRVDQYDYIYIKSGSGCSSNLGKIGGKQTISLLKNGCLGRSTIVHELIHTLGFDHMQNRSDRDKYVWILWDNIESKQKHNFDKVDSKRFKNFDTPYDYYSVMHYDPLAFSKNKKRTIIPKLIKYRNVIGQLNGMSKGDAIRLKRMYQC